MPHHRHRLILDPLLELHAQGRIRTERESRPGFELIPPWPRLDPQPHIQEFRHRPPPQPTQIFQTRTPAQNTEDEAGVTPDATGPFRPATLEMWRVVAADPLF